MSKHPETKKPDDYANYRDIMSEKEYEEFMEDYTADTQALLYSAIGHTDAALVDALLKKNNIPAIIKWRDAGDALMVYMAMSSTQADFYVPSKLLEEAETLLFSEMDNLQDAEPDEEFLEYAEQKAAKGRSNAKKIILLVFTLPLAITMLYIVWEVLIVLRWWFFW